MKSLLPLLLLLPALALADSSIELLGGSITYHLSDNGGGAYLNTNKLSNNGQLISNPLGGLRLIQEGSKYYLSETLFGGENSVGFPMAGSMVSAGRKLHGFYLGVALGAYFQNDNQFRSSGEGPYYLSRVSAYDLVPLAGFEINYRVDLCDKIYFKINNLLTPILTNSSISLGMSF